MSHLRPLARPAAALVLLVLFLAPAARGEFVPDRYVLFQDDAAAFESRPVVVQLLSGTRIKGTLVGESDADYVLANPQLGQLTIAKADVVALLGPGAALGPASASAQKPPPPGLFGTFLLRGWDKSLALGFTGKSGNTEAFDIYAKFSGDFDREDQRWRVRVSYVYGTAEGAENKNEGYANARRDWLLPDEPLFYWAEARTDYNAFTDYVFRAGGFAGVGYTFRDTPKLKLLARLGVGGSYEFGVVDEFTPEALLSVETRYQITPNQSVEFLNTLFPDLGELGRNRNVTEAAYTVKIDRGRGISVKLGLQNEYNSYTQDDSFHNDLTYFGALVFEF